MRAADVQQVVSQAQRAEQAQQALAHQAAAQQQAAAQKVEARRLELATRPEKAEARPGRSAVYNDERRDEGQGGREAPKRERRPGKDPGTGADLKLDRLA